MRNRERNPKLPLFLAVLSAAALTLLTACPTGGAVTGVSLDQPSLDLVPGKKSSLVATVSPATASNRSVVFASDNAAVATVSSGGTVTCLSKGSARITVTTAEGGFTASCDLTVEDFPATRKFVSANFATNLYYYVNSTLMAQSAHAAVYVQTSKLSSVSAATAQAVCKEFDATIYGLMHSNFGVESDVDSNGKVIFLIQDILDTYSGPGSGYVAGFFNPENELSSATDSYSNEADMLYLDLSPATVGSADFYGTIAHELQHLINFTHTYMVDGTEQDTWINEGLSSGAEYCYAHAKNPSDGQIQDRIDYYNTDPSGTIFEGNTFFVWNGYFENSSSYTDAVLADYATDYLFFQWLQIQSSDGTAIYKDILDSSYRDYQAVTTAATAHIYSSSVSWSDILRDWFMANTIQNSSGIYGYKGSITGLTVHAWTLGSTTWNQFEPGSGIISTLSGAYTPSMIGTNIAYVAFNTASSPDIQYGAYPAGYYLLTYNTNTSISGSAETGSVADYSSSLALASSAAATAARAAAAANLKPAAFRMDAVIHPDGRLGAGGQSPQASGSRSVLSGTAKLEER